MVRRGAGGLDRTQNLESSNFWFGRAGVVMAMAVYFSGFVFSACKRAGRFWSTCPGNHCFRHNTFGKEEVGGFETTQESYGELKIHVADLGGWGSTTHKMLPKPWHVASLCMHAFGLGVEGITNEYLHTQPLQTI